MNFVKTVGSFQSVSDLAKISYAKYVPVSGEVKAVLQIAHGMAEHKERYEKFADYLCSQNVAVYINDHLGHGESVASKDEKGYFGKMSYQAMVEDARKLTEIAKDEYPAIPYFVFGHSMGSFVMRIYLAKYGDLIDGAIICGTGGSNPALGIGMALTKLIAKCKGDHHRSKFIDNLAFGAYNKKFEGRTNFDWLTKDNDIVDEYIADEECGYLFTVNGFLGLFGALKYANSKECFETTPNIPILMISGENDPVGGYGKGVKEVYENLCSSGHKHVTMCLYENARHEVLNESDIFDKVTKDISEFIESAL